jgi:hypothetical protein
MGFAVPRNNDTLAMSRSVDELRGVQLELANAYCGFSHDRSHLLACSPVHHKRNDERAHDNPRLKRTRGPG